MKMDATHFRAKASRMSAKKICIIIAIFVFIFWYYYYITGRNTDYKKPFIIYPKINKPEFSTACGIRVENNPIIKVDNFKTYLLGSYIEHRLEVKTLKTIAIVLRSEKAEYQCFFCCKGTNISIPATYSIYSNHFGYDYGTADITCQVPETCTTPMHVAITSPSPPAEASQNVKILQPVRNQQTRDVFPYNFTVCISVMYDYTNVLELVQTMEMFKILGIQRVAIYKTNCDPAVQKVLDYYVKQNLVEIIPWTISSYLKVSRGWKTWESPGELHYFGQIPALNDCVYRYMYQSRYVALQDLDELILPVPVSLENWSELLPELERKYGQNKGFKFENNFFPLTIKETNSDYSPDLWKNVVGVNIFKYMKKLRNDPSKFNFKVIVNPRLVYSASVHNLLQSVGGTIHVDYNIAHIYHFRNMTFKEPENSLIQDTRLRDYADRLIPAISKVLTEVLDVKRIFSNHISVVS